MTLMGQRSHIAGATTILFLVCWVCGLGESAQASDWPQWRHDASRTAGSQEELADDLYLSWVRELAAPKPAYPRYPRLCFDSSYEPVVLGKTIFVPSMVTDSLTALDTDTGRQKWKFFTDGPVRFAPVATEGRVAFVSDDGHLYCVDAEQGSLVWKVCGLPPGCEDRKVLGNDRLISLWPARGGPVLHQGRIYFAVGVWPFEGVSVYAVDAATGNVVWANHDTGLIEQGLIDHSMRQESGLSPQGYLAVIGEKLFVPSGRAMPGVLDLDTGKLQPYLTGWGGRDNQHKGCWYVAGNDKYFFQSGDPYLAATGTRLAIDPANAKELGAFRDPVLDGQTTYFSQPINRPRGYRPVGVGYDKIVAWNVANPPELKEWKDEAGRQWKTGEFPELWSLASDLRIHVKAGSRLFGGAVDRVAAVDLPAEGETPKVSWTAAIQGTPTRMLAADGKLFVVTAEGRIHAFSPAKTASPKYYSLPVDRSLAADEQWADMAAESLKHADPGGGYCLVLGLESERFLRELLRQSQMHVIVVEPDDAKVAASRRSFDRDGLYGQRIAIHCGDPRSFPLPPYFAGLVIANRSILSTGESTRESLDSSLVKGIFRSLRPFGGVAILPLSTNGQATAKVSELAGGLAGAKVSRSAHTVVLKRTGSPPGSGEWTHEDGNAGRSLVAQDKRVKSPLDVLWFGGAIDMLYPEWDFTHSRPPSALVAGGRMFFQVFPDLHAVDIYTGRPLWTRRLPGTEITSRRRNVPYATAKDRLYVVAGDAIAGIDPATGATVSEIGVPDGASGNWRSLAIVADRLIGTTNKRVIAVDRFGGEAKWQYEAQRTPLAVAVGGDTVFCADASVPDRRGEITSTEGRIVALDVATGNLQWTADWKGDGPMKSAPRLVVCEQGDVVIAVCGSVSAYDRSDGSLLWGEKAIAGGEQPILYPDRLVSQLGTTYNPRTGAQLPERFWNLRKRGCTRNMGGQHVFSIRHAHASFLDLATKEHVFFRGIRTGCTNGLIQAGGIMNAPDFAHGCSCNYPIFTSYALVHLPEIDE
jgi:outer membrane protein assembly factor BamB